MVALTDTAVGCQNYIRIWMDDAASHTVSIGIGVIAFTYFRGRRTDWRLRGGDLPNATA